MAGREGTEKVERPKLGRGRRYKRREGKGRIEEKMGGEKGRKKRERRRRKGRTEGRKGERG
jgi:hypothetical protein